MAFDSKGLDDYVDVATRIAEFRDTHPEGRLRPLNPAEPWRVVQVQGYRQDGELWQQTFICVTAAAYRSADDPLPGVGMAWEIFPGRTPYTRNSELMNAETSAWGRAIQAALAADARKGVASREEVRNRQAERDDGLPQNADGSLSRSRTTDEEKTAAGVMTGTQQRAHNRLERETRGGGPQGTQRFHGPPPGEQEWQEPASADTVPPLDATLMQLSIEFTRLGVRDRDAKLRELERLARAEPGSYTSSRNLPSEAEARRILGVLKDLPDKVLTEDLPQAAREAG